MITKTQFVPGKVYFYSDFYDKSYCLIEAIKINKKRSSNFWFTAKIVDNTHLDGKNRDWNANGTIHSYSNSFIFKSLFDLKASIIPYKKRQLAFVKATFKMAV